MFIAKGTAACAALTSNTVTVLRRPDPASPALSYILERYKWGQHQWGHCNLCLLFFTEGLLGYCRYLLVSSQKC